MTDTTEHRGWEISTNYHEHWLDDPDYDLAEDSSKVSTAPFFFCLAFAVIFGLAIHFGEEWVAPPIVKFPAPKIVPVVQWTFPAGWQMECLSIDGANKTIQPNWADPGCRARAKAWTK